MATYQGIKGRTVQNLASDPPAAVGQGQVWYNTATDALKTSIGVGAWAAGNTYPTVVAYVSNCGTQTASVCASGKATNPIPGSPTTTASNEYDGTSWAATGVVGTARYGTGTSGVGTQTAALFTGGYEPANSVKTEEYNGSTWTEVNSLNTTQQYQMQSAGSPQTAAVAVSGSPTSVCEEYDGTSWATSPGALNTAGFFGGGCGTLTATIAAAGQNRTTNAEEYDGSTWTAVNAFPTATSRVSMCGIQTAAIYAGGQSPPPSIVNLSGNYDGTSWSAGPTIGTAREIMGGAGTQTKALMVGGGNPAPTANNLVEEFNLAGTIQTITSS